MPGPTKTPAKSTGGGIRKQKKPVVQSNKPVPSHPTWVDMIKECIVANPDDARSGVSRPQIKRFVETKYKLEIGVAQNTQLSKALTTGQEKGIFVMPKGPSGRVKLAPKTRTVDASDAKENKPVKAKPSTTKTTTKAATKTATTPKATSKATTKAKTSTSKSATTKKVSPAAKKNATATTKPKVTTVATSKKSTTPVAKKTMAGRKPAVEKKTTSTKRGVAKKEATGTSKTKTTAAKKAAPAKKAAATKAAKPGRKAPTKRS